MHVDRVIESEDIVSTVSLADLISRKWDNWNDQRSKWLSDKEEIRNYVFATDTAHTAVGQLPWKNKTTIPKLCQIRDNLTSNYMSALFPNDDWLKWEGFTLDDDELEKKDAIQAYMANKTRNSDFRHQVNLCINDYVDYGVCIGDVVWANQLKDLDGEIIPGYVGPRFIRRSPTDVVFDPTALSFNEAPKITRSLIQFGQLEQMTRSLEGDWIHEALAVAKETRTSLGTVSKDDFIKSNAYSVDGFGNIFEYYASGYCEVLEFEGTIHDPETGEYLDDTIITVIDRKHVVRKEDIPSWKRGGMKTFTAWRKRPDNLYGMGPLDNLVGLQYRLDHLENAKSDAWDLMVTPAWKIIGDVDEFEFYPGCEVHMAENGDIQPLVKPSEALSVNTELGYIMSIMEEMAGAPKEAMGIRTPGEKTAFEVQSLNNAAGRVFQEKITQFEVEFLEPSLNNMLELAARNLNTPDIVRVMDDDFGVANFLEISKEDIKAKGKIRPVGARHFAHQAQLIQNLTQISNTPIWAKIERHMSDKQLAKAVEDSLQVARFHIYGDNAALFEQAEAQKLMGQIQEDVQTSEMTPANALDEEPSEEEILNPQPEV